MKAKKDVRKGEKKPTNQDGVGLSIDDQLILQLRRLSNTQLKVSFKVGGVPSCSQNKTNRRALGPSDRIMDMWGGLFSGQLPQLASKGPQMDEDNSISNFNGRKSSQIDYEKVDHEEIQEKEGSLLIEEDEAKEPAPDETNKRFVQFIDVLRLIPDYGPLFHRIVALPTTNKEMDELCNCLREKIRKEMRSNEIQRKREQAQLNKLKIEINELQRQVKSTESQTQVEEPELKKKINKEEIGRN